MKIEGIKRSAVRPKRKGWEEKLFCEDCHSFDNIILEIQNDEYRCLNCNPIFVQSERLNEKTYHERFVCPLID